MLSSYQVSSPKTDLFTSSSLISWSLSSHSLSSIYSSSSPLSPDLPPVVQSTPQYPHDNWCSSHTGSLAHSIVHLAYICISCCGTQSRCTCTLLGHNQFSAVLVPDFRDFPTQFPALHLSFSIRIPSCLYATN